MRLEISQVIVHQQNLAAAALRAKRRTLVRQAAYVRRAAQRNLRRDRTKGKRKRRGRTRFPRHHQLGDLGLRNIRWNVNERAGTAVVHTVGSSRVPQSLIDRGYENWIAAAVDKAAASGRLIDFAKGTYG